MSNKIILDTTIFIHFFRGRKAASTYLSDISKLDKTKRLVSVITVAELYFGCISRDQVKKTKELLQQFSVIGLNEKIMINAGELRIKSKVSAKKARLADMLIAATALSENATLQTHNSNDFNWISELTVQTPYQLST